MIKHAWIFAPLIKDRIGAGKRPLAHIETINSKSRVREPTAFLQWRANVLAAMAAVLLFSFKWNIIRVLAAGAAGGLILSLAA